MQKSTAIFHHRSQLLAMLTIAILVFCGQHGLVADIVINDGMNGTVNSYSIIFSPPSHPNDLSSPQPPVGQISGGNPAHWLELRSIYDVNRDGNGVPVGSGNVELSFRLVNESITYNPLTSGTVLDISFSVDINFSDFTPVQFQEYYFWVQDGNSAFLANSANSTILPTNGNWETITLSGLTSANLVGIDFTGGEGPLKFGFGFVSSGDVTSEPPGFIGLSMGVDNFVVTVNAVPEPSSGLLAGSLLMFAAGRRRIRRA